MYKKSRFGKTKRLHKKTTVNKTVAFSLLNVWEFFYTVDFSKYK